LTRIYHFYLTLIASGLAACGGNSGQNEIPGNVLEMTFVGKETENITRTILLSGTDYVVAHVNLDALEADQRYRIAYSGLLHKLCSDPELSRTDRKALAALRSGQKKSTIIDGKIYKNLGIKDISINGEVRSAQAFKTGDVEAYFDKASGSIIAEKSPKDKFDYFIYVTNVKRNQPLDPEMVTYAKDNCVPKPLE